MFVLKVLDRILYICVIIITLLILACFAVPRLFGYTPYEVATASMSDVYPVGSLIYVSETSPENISPDDIITIRLNGLTVTHRVTAVDLKNKTVTTKGDMNNTTDGQTRFSDIIGKTSEVCIPHAGKIAGIMTQKKGRQTVLISIAAVFSFLFISETIIKKHS